ncbi:MAG TPA: thioredoxin family protein, partial [Bacteroidales bacterium]
ENHLKSILNKRYMEIKILGPGCPKCKTLDKLTREVVEKNGINATITKVEDIMEIMKYGVMSTPALVVDEKVVVKGRVPSQDEIKQLLTK